MKDSLRQGEDIDKIVAMGTMAVNYVRSVVKRGDTVRIEFDVQEKDKYGRTLGYVYLPDGRMLNEEIIKAGYASPLTIQPNVKYQNRFLKAYRKAREQRNGLFSTSIK